MIFLFFLPTLLPFLCTKSRTHQESVAGAGLSLGKNCISRVTVICTVSEFLLFISCLPRQSQGACRPVDIYASGENPSHLFSFHLLNASFIFFPASHKLSLIFGFIASLSFLKTSFYHYIFSFPSGFLHIFFFSYFFFLDVFPPIISIHTCRLYLPLLNQF